jgi:flagellar assembly protein FliH
MATVRKFQFDNSFDTKPESVEPVVVPIMPEPESEPAPPPPPRFSFEELEAARKAAWIDGKMQGEAEIRASLTQRVTAAAEQIAASLGQAAQQQKSAVDAIERQAAETLLALLRKLFPATLELTARTEIEALLRDAFAHARHEPRLIVRCAPNIRAELEPIVRAEGDRSGFEGRLSILADPTLADQDCRIEWAEGGVERRPDRMMTTFEAAVAGMLAHFDRNGTEAFEETAA